MEGGDSLILSNVDSLILQLALQSQKLSLKKNGIQQQVQSFQENIVEMKAKISNTKRNIEKLDEDLSQKQKVVAHYKDSIKSLRGNNRLLLQFTHVLQEDLLKRQENYAQDVKIFEERIDSYRKVFELHKAQYCQSSLAQKLLKIQGEKELIDQRIVALEQQIAAKEKEKQSVEGTCSNSLVNKNTLDNCEQQIPLEFQMQVSEETQMEGIEVGPEMSTSTKDVMNIEENHSETATPVSDNGTSIHPTWTSVNGGGTIPSEGESPPAGELQETHVQSEETQISVQKGETQMMGEQEERAEVRKVSHVSEQQDTEETHHPRTLSARMKAVSSTPIFSLSGSPRHSPACFESLESPAFTFALPSAPNTPGFSGFDSTFHTESAQEDNPFSFSNSYFDDKKSSGSKSTGFLFGQAGGRAEEEFGFSFSSKDGSPATCGTEQGMIANTPPFSFTFGKF